MSREFRLRSVLTAGCLAALLLAPCAWGEDLPLERVSPEVRTSNFEATLPCSDGSPCAVLAWSAPEVLSAVDDTVKAKLQREIRELALGPSLSEEGFDSPEALRDAFFADFREHGQEGLGYWFEERRVEVVYRTAGVLTLEAVHDSFRGGAHPNHAKILKVLDITTGHALAPGDLLIDGWEERLRADAEARFRKQRDLSPEENLEAAGFWFEGGRFTLPNNFGVVEEGLLFHFNPYDVGPWVLGPTSVVVPWDVFGDLILAGGPLGALEDV